MTTTETTTTMRTTATTDQKVDYQQPTVDTVNDNGDNDNNNNSNDHDNDNNNDDKVGQMQRENTREHGKQEWLKRIRDNS